MRRLLALLTASAAALLLALGADARPAAAHHEWFVPGGFYRPYMGGGTYGAFPHWDNYTMRRWLDGQPVRWGSDTGPLEAATELAVADWTTVSSSAFSTMAYQEVGLSGSQDLTIQWTSNISSACGGLTDLAACVDPTWGLDSTRNAFYITSARIWVDANAVFDPAYNGLRSLLAHELGHLYGLEDVYGHHIPVSGVALGGASSIMDYGNYGICGIPPGTYGCINGTVSASGPPLLGPAAQDVTRVKAYQGGGEPAGHTGSPHWNARVTNWSATNPASLTYRAEWDDTVWGETYQYVYFYRYNPGPGTYDWLYGGYGVNRIGVHRYYNSADGRLDQSWDGNVLGFGAGQYVMCIRPIYLTFPNEGQGTGTCGVTIQVN